MTDVSVTKNKLKKVAPIIDRLLAFVLDLALFTPLFSLILSQLFKKLQFRYYASPDSLEFLVLLSITVVSFAALTILAQTIAVAKWQTTPGKYFLKLKIISLVTNDQQPGDQKVGWSQAFLRSGFWVIEFFFLGIPFVELLSQRERRALHDRASETMVVTLKSVPDDGPHLVEAQFVRNFLFLLIAMCFLWGSLVVGKLYTMASRGDFKKTELEDEQYLCASVSQNVEKGDNRMDVALARYLAAEVEQDCLLSESDFALWSDDSVLKSWAYLAKGFYFKYDKEKSEKYFAKVCEVDSKNQACQLAKVSQEKKTGKLSKVVFEDSHGPSLTFRILIAKEYIALGEFEKAQQKIFEIAEAHSGFEKFSQKETVRLLWAQGKTEQAMGAYINTWSHMDSFDKTDIASWLCVEQVDENCENHAYLGCNNLKENLRQSQYAHVNIETVIGLTKEKECKHSSERLPLAFRQLLDSNPALNDYFLAISSESGWSSDRRIDILRKLSFSSGNNQEVSSSRILNRQAMISLMKISKDPKDFLRISSYLAARERKDWSYKKISAALAGYAPQKKGPSLRIPASSRSK